MNPQEAELCQALGLDPEAPRPSGRPMPHLAVVMELARVSHEIVRGYREAIGDGTCPPWVQTTKDERMAAAQQVVTVLKFPALTAAELHSGFVDTMRDRGWTFGEVMDEEKKTHPLLVDYDQLPLQNRIEDALFCNTIRAIYC